ncbi:uncharacterized protein LOC143277681 [Babylonia areolata]|uniref:uncharacterized protein LOC143277681 n=1 Tax=Babylonia areolata TaxID=304850 RepID=UPI003FD65570
MMLPTALVLLSGLLLLGGTRGQLVPDGTTTTNTGDTNTNTNTNTDTDSSRLTSFLTTMLLQDMVNTNEDLAAVFKPLFSPAAQMQSSQALAMDDDMPQHSNYFNYNPTTTNIAGPAFADSQLQQQQQQQQQQCTCANNQHGVETPEPDDDNAGHAGNEVSSNSNNNVAVNLWSLLGFMSM